MEELLVKLTQYIDLIYLGSFLILSYGVKNYLGDWLNKITKTKWKTVYTVLIIATIMGVVFVGLFGSDPKNIVLSYFVGTSLHETIFWWIEKKLKNVKNA